MVSQIMLNMMEKSTVVLFDLEVLEILDSDPGQDPEYVAVPKSTSV